MFYIFYLLNLSTLDIVDNLIHGEWMALARIVYRTRSEAGSRQCLAPEESPYYLDEEGLRATSTFKEHLRERGKRTEVEENLRGQSKGNGGQKCLRRGQRCHML